MDLGGEFSAISNFSQSSMYSDIDSRLSLKSSIDSAGSKVYARSGDLSYRYRV